MTPTKRAEVVVPVPGERSERVARIHLPSPELTGPTLTAASLGSYDRGRRFAVPFSSSDCPGMEERRSENGWERRSVLGCFPSRFFRFLIAMNPFPDRHQGAAMASDDDDQVTIADYLSFERASQERHEYVEGIIRQMPSSSLRHSRLVMNTGCSLGQPLKNRPIVPLMVQMRTRAGENGRFYYYPDVVLSPEPAILEDEHQDTLLNPIGLVEVVSQESDSIDRGEKLANYAAIDSLNDYVIVAQDHVRIDHFSRQSDGSWRLVTHDDLTRTVNLTTSGVELPLAEIYDRVFPAEPEAS